MSVLPLNDHTHQLIGEEVLAALPDGALVVNVGRGSVGDTAALTKAVLSGRRQCASDVVDPAPLPPCLLCGRPLGRKVEWHHIVPKSRGGTEMAPVHPICHRTIHATLTNREIEIIQLINKEFSNKAIAQALFISERTVETHRKNIFRKTNTQSVVGLLRYAREQMIV